MQLSEFLPYSEQSSTPEPASSNRHNKLPSSSPPLSDLSAHTVAATEGDGGDKEEEASGESERVLDLSRTATKGNDGERRPATEGLLAPVPTFQSPLAVEHLLMAARGAPFCSASALFSHMLNQQHRTAQPQQQMVGQAKNVAAKMEKNDP